MGKIFSSINDHAPLYNLRQNLQTLQRQKGTTQIQHPRQYKSKINMMSMSTISYTKWRYQHRYRSWLLAFVIANLMQAYRYRYDIDIKVRQRQDKTIFLRNNVSMIMVCPGACEMISIWYQHKVKIAKYRCVRCLYRYSCWNWQIDIDTI